MGWKGDLLVKTRYARAQEENAKLRTNNSVLLQDGYELLARLNETRHERNDLIAMLDAANTKQAQKEINELGDMEAVIVYGEFALDIKPAIDYILNYEGHIDAKMGQGLFDLIDIKAACIRIEENLGSFDHLSFSEIGF